MDSKIITLFKKYINGQCNPAELEQVLDILQNGKHLAEWDAAIKSDADVIIRTERQSELSEREIKAIYSRIENKLITPDNSSEIATTPRKNIRIWSRIAIAAMFLIAISVGLYYYQQNDVIKENASVIPKKKVPVNDKKAYLTLADGKKISLTDAANGYIAMQSGISITKTADGQLKYTYEGNSRETSAFNTIETPRGGLYQIQLPDGTKVWLNAASSLHYPTRFIGKERIVDLVGEAYFEVAKNKQMPFKVKTNYQVVEVLGTHFNISGYPDENQIKTTLLEGSVKVTQKQNSVILQPGQQAEVLSGSESDIKTISVDAADAVAWKSGYFLFEDADIQYIMKYLSRWYDINVEYNGKITDQKFFGAFQKTDNINDLLRNLETYGNVHFKVTGRRVIVMP